ncbi:MAG TPA: LPS-assembly protein LptD [Ignavibacteria bacterium]|nr:LPS-assembly protein LptD [Ignavibacteria bacterium]
MSLFIKPNYILAISILFFLSGNFIFAQSSTSLKNPNSDTLIVKKINTDTLFTKSSNPSTVDTIIYASSRDSLILKVNEKKMNLYGKSEIKFKSTDLKSAVIYVDFNTYSLKARGIVSDSIPGRIIGKPVLIEGSDSYTGSKIDYNFKTTRGMITAARTSEGDSYFTGEKIHKVNSNTYFIADGIYTTCNHNPPHYYFYSPKMKMVQNEQIVARWVWLYLGGVPFPVPLPFAVFPIRSGRRSGIIIPAIGNDARFGQYLSRFGYYWAINDYMDINLTANYYTRGSFSLSSRFRYVKRYDYNGSFQLGYKYFIKGESTDPDRTESQNWQIRWRHTQKINPTLRLDVNIDFASSNYLNLTSINLSQVLRREIVSNATLFKTWEKSGNSLAINYSRRQVLKTNKINEVIPSVRFSKAQSYPFKKSSDYSRQKWYELFGYSYNGQFKIERNRTGGGSNSRGGFLHTISASMSPKVGHFSISPTFNYQERWYNRRIERTFAGMSVDSTDSIVTKDVKGINFVRSFSVGISASTRFYGMFKPNILGIAAIRQTVNPSISYSYRPDFSSPKWGYYGTYVNSRGETVKYDKYTREIYGGAPAGESQSISFSIANVFEMKTKVDPTDTTSKEKKIRLLNLSAGLSYNFVADSMKLSNLFVSYRTQVGTLFNFSGSSSFTFYDYVEGVGPVNKFLINEGKGLFRMTSLNLSISTRLAGSKSKDGVKKDSTKQKDALSLIQESNVITRGLYTERETDFSIPWNVSLNFNYSISKPTPSKSNVLANVNANVNFNLTRNWNLSFTGSYDFVNKKIVVPQIRISRDLHAWILNFMWNPIGTYRGYRLEIKVKAPQLSDLKLTKRDQFFSGR